MPFIPIHSIIFHDKYRVVITVIYFTIGKILGSQDLWLIKTKVSRLIGELSKHFVFSKDFVGASKNINKSISYNIPKNSVIF